MPSTFNPSGSYMNCFFVTVTYLLGLDSVNDLPQPVRDKMNRSRGIAAPDGIDTEMEDCLKQTGRPYLLKSWVDLTGPNPDNRQGSEVLGGRHGGGDGNIVWREEQFLFGEWNVNQIGIGYTTAENKAHFLVVKDTNPPSYVCFQEDTGGTERWKEVRGQEQEINGNWHDVINKNRSKVLCAFAFKDVPGPRGHTQGPKGHTPGPRGHIPEPKGDPSGPKRAPKSRSRRFWSKLCCFF
ncbi:hypothetical protein KVR01_000552 [Diaporthe batatas]|uniref:uncharacterized protein n=1 Tax=Diaporthe batatas TaxID=748121 RepID=UPI001D059B6E|nr:uncharacterized protein KVR01_000552 [Diaporthe batatas]KAG8169807.1 hypothetical protein KVR01_000552 [Diaporthe batatas]